MDTKTNRRLQLLWVIETMFGGKHGKCADELEIKRSQLSRWVTDNESVRQGISEDAARSIEEKLGLPRGALDESMEPKAAAQPDTVMDDFAWVYNNATDDGKSFLRGAIAAARAAYITDQQATRKKA